MIFLRMTLPTDTASPAGHKTMSPEISTPAPLKPGPRPAVPEEARLEMPTQSLSRHEKASRKPKGDGGTWLARLLIFGGALALTWYGGWQMYKVVSVGGTTTLEWALLVLFVANFSWIALAFTSSLVGFVWMLFLAPRALGIPAALTTRTAIVMPIYNESPERVFAAVEAMYEEVEATGLGRSFDWFFLSDTTDRRRLRRRGSRLPEDARALRRAGRASSIATGRRTRRARPATSPTSSPAGAAATTTCWCSTPIL